ncbi:MAG: arylsulfatase [Planctomycetota bacterium]|nr:arylsulfatase [Planctomycetota bacterium]
MRNRTSHWIAVCCIAVFSLVASPVASQADERPNVIVFLADDLGFSDIGCYGGEVETPVLDSLAAGGLRYTQFYNTARCWPTRAAILTGYYPQQIGRDALPGVPGGNRFGRPDWAELVPKKLKPLGYRSYISGKWHIDGKPIANGFDRSFTMDDHNRFFNPQNMSEDDKRLPPIPKGTDYYATTGIADHAIKVLKEHEASHSDKPFFHYVAFICPHFPLHAPAKEIAKYKGRFDNGWDVARQQRFQRMKDMGIVRGELSKLEPEIGPPYTKWSDPAKEQLGEKEVVLEKSWNELSKTQQAFQATKMEIHAAMVDKMDQEIGRVIDQVKAMDEFENTLILFLSDNGASAEIMIRGDGHDDNASPGSAESYLCLGPGWSSAANTPFRRHKTWVHEGGAATPLIAHWPKGIAARGELRQRVGHVVDIPHTIVDLAGGKWSNEFQGKPIPESPGASIAPSFSEDINPQRSLWWLHEGNRAVRKGNYKLVAAKNESWQLYDMTEDRAESNDLRVKMPAKARELQDQWQAITDQYERLAKERMRTKKGK